MIRSKVNGLILSGHNHFITEVVKLGQGKFAEITSVKKPTDAASVKKSNKAIKETKEKKEISEPEVL